MEKQVNKYFLYLTYFFCKSVKISYTVKKKKEKKEIILH